MGSYIERIKTYGDHEFLTCMQGVDGHCYYIASLRTCSDYGDKFGRVFIAYQNHSDRDEVRVMIEVGVSKTLAAISRFNRIWPDPNKFFLEYGLNWMRRILSSPIENTFKEKRLLTTDADASEYTLSEYDPLPEQKRLREDILAAVAKLEATTGRRVQKAQLLTKLCTDPKWVDRQLRVLEEMKLLEGITQDEMRVTGVGHLKLEDGDKDSNQLNPSTNASGRLTSKTFDIFVSYASEDLPIVKKLVASLEGAGIVVWHDVGQITLGDSITDKINVGLSGSRFGLFVLSEKFLAKRWPMTELRTLFAKQTSSGEKYLLPLLYGIDAAYLHKNFPLLTDLRAEQVDEESVEHIVGIVSDQIRRATA